MLVRVKVSDGVFLEQEATSEEEAFDFISRSTEAFCHTTCGKCGCKDVKFLTAIRGEDENKWREIVCQNPQCRAKLTFGLTKKEKKIFPKRRWDNLSDTQQKDRADEKEYADNHNGYLPNGGWFVFKKND